MNCYSLTSLCYFQNEEFHIKIEYPSDISRATISCDWKLRCLLADCLDVLKQV